MRIKEFSIKFCQMRAKNDKMVTKENQEKLDNLNKKIIEIKSKQLLNVKEESLLNQLMTEKSTLEGKLNQHYSEKSKGYFIRSRAN